MIGVWEAGGLGKGEASHGENYSVMSQLGKRERQQENKH